MNSPYMKFISGLSDADLQKLQTHDLMISINDEHYLLADNGFNIPDTIKTTDLKTYLYNNQNNILKMLYQTQPLCKDEFNYQAMQFFKYHGAEKFCHYKNNTNNLALMIENEKLITVSRDDPRNQYGYFYTHQSLIDDNMASKLVLQWLDSGSAYNDYRVKTHCRYICS